MKQIKATVQLSNTTDRLALRPNGHEPVVPRLRPFPPTAPLPPTPSPCPHRRLAGVSNWPELTVTAAYHTGALARLCGVSTRELERFFRLCAERKPHCWLNLLRQVEGLLLLAETRTVKQTAYELRYTHPAHFSRDFKLFYGIPPTAVQRSQSLRPLLRAALCRFLVTKVAFW